MNAIRDRIIASEAGTIRPPRTSVKRAIAPIRFDILEAAWNECLDMLAHAIARARLPLGTILELPTRRASAD